MKKETVTRISLIISVLLNVFFLYLLKPPEHDRLPFLDNLHYWDNVSLTTSGVVVYDDKRLQDLDKFQYFKINCFENSCQLVEAFLDYHNILIYNRPVEITYLNYEASKAVVKYADCTFTMTKENTVVTCANTGKAVLGSQIGLY